MIPAMHQVQHPAMASHPGPMRKASSMESEGIDPKTAGALLIMILTKDLASQRNPRPRQRPALPGTTRPNDLRRGGPPREYSWQCHRCTLAPLPTATVAPC